MSRLPKYKFRLYVAGDAQNSAHAIANFAAFSQTYLPNRSEIEVVDGEIVEKKVPALNALNAKLRDDYIKEVQGGLDRWNRIPEKLGVPFRFALPHVGFHRKIGTMAGQFITPDGKVMTEAEWNSHRDHWLPTKEDNKYIESLMGRVLEPGKFANWIAAPARGINNQPVEFEYVRFS